MEKIVRSCTCVFKRGIKGQVNVNREISKQAGIVSDISLQLLEELRNGFNDRLLSGTSRQSGRKISKHRLNKANTLFPDYILYTV